MTGLDQCIIYEIKKVCTEWYENNLKFPRDQKHNYFKLLDFLIFKYMCYWLTTRTWLVLYKKRLYLISLVNAFYNEIECTHLFIHIHICHKLAHCLKIIKIFLGTWEGSDFIAKDWQYIKAESMGLCGIHTQGKIR
jgi:hypothetical protein